jgi:hypothetical protein
MPGKHNSRYEVHDPVNGPIDLTSIAPIMHSPEVQRMGMIKQLGGAYWVWPGATHTRLNHMQGTVHSARQTANSLYERGSIGKNAVRLIEVVSGIHDVGHWAFSHFMERLYGNHDERGLELVKGPLAKRIEECDVDLRDVIDTFQRKTKLSEIIFANPIGADKRDYLRRDAICTLGEDVMLGGFNYHQVGWDDRNGFYVLAEGQPLLIKTAQLSWHMFTAVYEHPDTRVCQRYIQELLRLMTDLDKYVRSSIKESGEDGVLGAIRVWCQKQKNRHHECAERQRRFEQGNYPRKALILSPYPHLVPVNKDDTLAKIECSRSLPSKSECWPIDQVADLEAKIAEMIGTTAPRVSLAVAPPARRWKIPDVKVLDNGTVRQLCDIAPEMEAMAGFMAKQAHSVVVAVPLDELVREKLVSDKGLQADIRQLLENV